MNCGLCTEPLAAIPLVRKVLLHVGGRIILKNIVWSVCECCTENGYEFATDEEVLNYDHFDPLIQEFSHEDRFDYKLVKNYG